MPGPVVRIGPNMLNYNDVEAYKEVYGSKANLQKSTRYAAASASARTPNLIAAVGTGHGVMMRRKAYLSMWNDRSLQHIEPQLQEMLSKMLYKLESSGSGADGWSADVDMQKAIEPCGYDATMFATIGVDPETSKFPDRRWMLEAARIAAWRASVVSRKSRR